ncbi:MAG: methylated-DNA--[Clostridia bacterium]|nr:methylated-DNA--[protein]-cysteine S-methyltransferase [Clostridia bacterium]
MLFCRRQSPLGMILLASDGEALTGLWFDGQKGAPVLPDDVEEERLPVFDEAGRWLRVYFAGCEPDFTPPLRPGGTAFQQTVWGLLRRIPYGETVTYGRLSEETARLLGRPRMSAQAVGGAVGRNPISLIVPCHRVIGADGSLTGYAGGLRRKEYLLTLERKKVLYV